MTATQNEVEDRVIAYYLVDQMDDPRRSGLEPQHFTVASRRTWWAKALDRTGGFIPEDLGIPPEDLMRLHGIRPLASAMPNLCARLRESWGARRLRESLKAAAVDLERNGTDAIVEVRERLKQAIAESEACTDAQVMTMGLAMSSTLTEYGETVRDAGSAGRTIPFAFANMNRQYGGWLRGKVYGVVAQSSHFKTTFARQSLSHAAHEGFGALYWNAEDSWRDLAAREIAFKTGVLDTRSLATGKIPDGVSPEGWVRAAQVASKAAEDEAMSRLRIIDIGQPKLSQIVAQIGSVSAKTKRTDGHNKASKGLDIVAIDFAQLIQPDTEMAPVQFWTHMLGTIQTLAKDLDIVILLLAQIDKHGTRQSHGEDTPPRLDDVFGGIAFRQYIYGGVVLFKNKDGLVIPDFQKNKSGGECTFSPMKANGAYDRLG